MKPWNFFAVVLMATRRRCSPQAAQRRADSATKRLQGISESISAWPRRWPISPSAAGRRVSSAFFTAKGATPLNSSPNRRSSWSAGRDRRHASFSLPYESITPTFVAVTRKSGVLCQNSRGGVQRWGWGFDFKFLIYFLIFVLFFFLNKHPYLDVH